MSQSVLKLIVVLFYTTCIRPVTEYACQVFHNSLPQYLSYQIEKLQKRAFRIIFSELHYQEVLDLLNISTLYDRRETLSEKLFSDIVTNDQNKLRTLLPPENSSDLPLRNMRKFQVPNFKTNRFKNSFIVHNSYRYLTYILNLSISTGVFVVDWKDARVIPIYKEGDRRNLGNYRPISILPIVSKVFEKEIFKQFYKNLNDNMLVPKFQSGSRPGHSTITTLLQCVIIGTKIWITAN